MIKPIVFLIVIFGLSVLVTSSCDFSHEICSSAGLTCPSPQTTISIGNGTYQLINIDVTVFGDITLNHGDIQGRVAARNNIYGQNGFSFGDALTDDLLYSLIAGNGLTFIGTGAVYPTSRRIFVGGTASASPAYTGPIDTCSSIGSSAGCLNSQFDSLSSYWTQFSNLMNAQSDNAVVSIAGGVATFTCSSSSSRNYFVHISSSNFNTITQYVTSGCSSTANWILTVSGGNVVFNGDAFRSSRSYVVFNMVNVPQVTLSSTVDGNIVAPTSNINVIAGDIVGVVIAGNITNAIQINIPIYSVTRVTQNCPTFSNAATSTSSTSSSSSSGTTTTSSTATGTASGSASNSSTPPFATSSDIESTTGAVSGDASGGIITASATSTATGSGGVVSGDSTTSALPSTGSASGTITTGSSSAVVVGSASNTENAPDVTNPSAVVGSASNVQTGTTSSSDASSVMAASIMSAVVAVVALI